jgi:cell wall-associated NlpC family hydrolase
VDRMVDGYAVAEDGFVWAGHVDPIDKVEPDFVAVAERLLEVPYLWGGKSALGVDCSGLVQLALSAAGLEAPRDSDMQERQLGIGIEIEGERRRGDLVFWPGHVGIMRDDHRLLHATAHTMCVASEPLTAAHDRIRSATGRDIRAIRRFPPAE